MAKKAHLGRGLSALLGGDEPAASDGNRRGGLRQVSVSLLHSGKYQPRTQFDIDELEALAASIEQSGILQPILVRPHPDKPGEYEIVAGERRWRAAQLAHIHEVPILERDLADNEALELALVENVQRQDLNPMEEAEAYHRLIAEFKYTQDRLAERIGKSRSTVTNLARLLQLPDSVRELIREQKLSEGHGRALLAAADPAKLAVEVVARGLSVRRTEELARSLASREAAAKPARKNTSKPAADAKDADTRALERNLTLQLGLKTEIAFDGAGGSITVHYRTLEQLDGLVAKLQR